MTSEHTLYDDLSFLFANMIKTFNFLFVTLLSLIKVKLLPGTYGSLATVKKSLEIISSW